LIHCLGAGQALKYAPIFGELMSELILEGRTKEFDLSEFSIRRFATKPLDKFWKAENQHVAENTL
jgi:glycine/D-amino acid oxidase-like deaminating enzyme